MNQKPETSDYLKLHFIVLIFGFTAILGKLTTVSSLALVLYRTFFAVLGLGFYAWVRGKNLKLAFREALPLLCTGALVSLHWICFFGSAKVSTVAISLVAFSTTSFFTSILEPLTKKKKISFVEVLLGLSVVLGLVVVFTFEFKYLLGIIIGLIGAFLSAIFSIINSHFAQKYDSQKVIFYEMTGAFLSSFIYIPLFIFLTKGFSISLTPSKTDWLWLGILGFGCTVFPYLEMQNLLKKISAFTLNLTINLEPIYGIILGYLVFGEKEKMNVGFYIGALVILVSVLSYPVLLKKMKN
jgi:drug/metabolite transporter (DMT)-like permease